MHGYEVVVGYIGCVYSGTSRRMARRMYFRYVQMVRRRNSNVTVVFFRDGDVVREFDPEMFRLGFELG